MTDKEFRRLSRADLIEIIYELQQNEKALQQENEDLKHRLEERRETVSEAGSLAEVLAKVNGLFEAAQATADGYQEEIRRLQDEAREEARIRLEEAREEARKIRAQADDYLADIKRQASKLAALALRQREELLKKTEEECRQLLAWAGENRPPSGKKPDVSIRSQEEDQCDGGGDA